MANDVSPIPAGYEGATPYLSVKDASQALEFYEQAFGAEVTTRLDMPDGRVAHAEIKIGQAKIMLADEFPGMDFPSPISLGGTPVVLHLYVPDADAFVERATEAGAELLHPVKDQFYGDRSGQIRDPFGHGWNVATHIEEVSDDEMQRRVTQMFQGE